MTRQSTAAGSLGRSYTGIANLAINPADRDSMEARVAKLESDVGHIRSDIVEIRTDIREVRAELRDFRKEVSASFESVRASNETIRGSIDSLKDLLANAKIGGVLLYVALAGTVLLTMAKGFKWL